MKLIILPIYDPYRLSDPYEVDYYYPWPYEWNLMHLSRIADLQYDLFDSKKNSEIMSLILSSWNTSTRSLKFPKYYSPKELEEINKLFK